MRTTVTLSERYRPIQESLDRVRDAVGQLWLDALQLVGVRDVEKPGLGGKMLRPALCLLSAGAIGGRPLGKYVKLATAFEALHIASLAHDDVIDRAILRRGMSSLPAMWDNHAAVLGGDYLVARAVETLAEYDSCAIIAKAISSVRRMAEGELFFFGRDDDDIRQEDCIMLAEHKTASLFAEACAAPSYVIDEGYREPLYRYGIGLGIAFQIVDDLLDVTQPPEQLGKPACGDVVEGKKTLPILFMREALDASGRARLDGYRDQELTDADREWIVDKAEATGALRRTEAIAREYADDAVQALQALEPSPYRDSMEGIVEFVLVRAF